MTTPLEFTVTADALTQQAVTGIRALIQLMGEDPDRPGLVTTPERVVNAYTEMANRPGNPAQLLGTVFTDVNYPTDEMIAVGPIDFVSLCEHHLLPFTGTAWVAYIPSSLGVVGLSKIPRLVEHYARRPQVQERLTTQITDTLVDYLDPKGAACVISATHACMSLRGIRKPGAAMVTSVIRGAIKTDPAARTEFLALTRKG